MMHSHSLFNLKFTFPIGFRDSTEKNEKVFVYLAQQPREKGSCGAIKPVSYR